MLFRGMWKLCCYRGLHLEPYASSIQRTSKYCTATNEGNIILPKLPVPKLKHTLDRYLDSVRPLLNEKEFAKTVILVKDFEHGLGQTSQNLLEKRAKDHVNWLEDFWLATAYLEYREPVVVHSSPGVLFPVRYINTREDQLRCAAKILLGTLEYKAIIDNNKLPQEMMGKNPLDMEPYKKIFGTCRIPWEKRDKLCYDNNSRHIAVIHNDHIFRLDLWGKDNVQLNEEQIIEQLNYIIDNSQWTNNRGIGILTSEHRDTWAKAYQLLLDDVKNQELLADVRDSIVVLCLDGPCGYANTENDECRRILGAHQVIHGGGWRCNSGNRWFDKTVQFIVGADGLTGLTFEHSPADGQPIAVLTDFLLKYIEENGKRSRPSSSCPEKPKRLDFNITTQLALMIYKAKLNMNISSWNLDLNCFRYDNYGKNFIKSQKLSPDSFIQMAIQFAFYRLHKEPGAHYESASTRMYARGRTETIRSCSYESVQFAKTMLNNSTSRRDKILALRNAIQSHKKYTVQALQGFGVDRHLLGLKLTAIRNGLQIHELYSDVSYTKSTHMRISTSQVSLKADGFMCYGPVVNDGYGTCYNPRDNDIILATSAFKDNPDTDLEEFKNALLQSLQEMHDIFEPCLLNVC